MEMGEEMMRNDLGFLEEGARLADNAVRLGREWDSSAGKAGTDVGMSLITPLLGKLDDSEGSKETKNGPGQGPGTGFEKTAKAHGVEMLRMPPGMKRARDNKSFVTTEHNKKEEGDREIAKRRKEKKKEKKKERRLKRMAEAAAEKKGAEEAGDVGEKAKEDVEVELEAEELPNEQDTEAAQLVEPDTTLDQPTTADPSQLQPEPSSQLPPPLAEPPTTPQESISESDSEPELQDDGKTIHWTLELVSFSLPSIPIPKWPDLSPKTIIAAPFSERRTISALLEDLDLSFSSSTRVYLASQVNQPGKLSLSVLQPTWTLLRSLHGKRILEFPTLWIVSSDNENIEIDEKLKAMQGLDISVFEEGEEMEKGEFEVEGYNPRKKRRREDGAERGGRGRGRGRGGWTGGRGMRGR